VAPKDALSQEGPYSRNNSSTSYHPSAITLHVIYPKSSDLMTRNFVQQLSGGCTGYLGFSGSGPPFYSDLAPVYSPVNDSTLVRWSPNHGPGSGPSRAYGLLCRSG